MQVGITLFFLSNRIKRSKKIMLHHHNASAYSVKLATEFLCSVAIKLMSYPPYQMRRSFYVFNLVLFVCNLQVYIN